MAPTLLSLCYSRFQNHLDVVLTEAAQKFVTRDLLESYGIRTWVDAFERRNDIYVPHVHLARSADCVLVMPASANSLHRFADGACTDLLSLLVAATHAPVVLAPAMNDAMWNNGAIQRNLQLLRADGMYVIEPTIIFGAADFASHGGPMYGGHGTLWSGPHSLMQALAQVMRRWAANVGK
jgi:phosphopantothenoylcysteine synthetase/decarboxylase